MGSFQQIAISIVCLCIAFGFGTYVNTHPSGPTGETIDVVQQNTSETSSNESIQDLEFVEKRPARMGMMRSPLKPRLTLPPSSFGGNSINQPPMLPSPSDLKSRSREEEQSPPPPDSSSSRAVDNSIVALFQNNGTPGIAQPNDVPDFADAAIEAGAMDSSLESPQTVLLKKLPPKERGIVAGDTPTHRRLTQKSTITPPTDPFLQSLEAEFTANDFEPQLLGADRKSTKIKSLTQPPSTLVETSSRERPDSATSVSGNDSISTDLTYSIGESPATDTRPRIPFKLNTARTQQLKDVKNRSESYDNFKEHIVQENESLQSISSDYFGKPDFYLDIYLANRENLRSPVGIKPGTKLKIPTINQP